MEKTITGCKGRTPIQTQARGLQRKKKRMGDVRGRWPLRGKGNNRLPFSPTAQARHHSLLVLGPAHPHASSRAREARRIIQVGVAKGRPRIGIMSMAVSGGKEDSGGGGGGGRPRPRRHHGEQRSGVATVVEGTMDSSPSARCPLPPRLAALRCLVPKILVSTL